MQVEVSCTWTRDKPAHVHFFPFQQVEALLSLVTELVTISKGTADREESIINRQTALYSLKLLSRLLSKDHPSQFKEVNTLYSRAKVNNHFNILSSKISTQESKQ